MDRSSERPSRIVVTPRCSVCSTELGSTFLPDSTDAPSRSGEGMVCAGELPMADVGLRKVVGRLRRGLADRVPDGDLLGRFVTSRDQAAFAELVGRHGPKVYAVCRRVLGHHQLAEDAYQATFVVLARRAHCVRPRSAVGGFLYGVANKAALKAATMSRRRKEVLVGRPPDAPSPDRAAVDPDALRVLDEEIANLSDPLRAAVVLCELDGLARAAAA